MVLGSFKFPSTIPFRATVSCSKKLFSPFRLVILSFMLSVRRFHVSPSRGYVLRLAPIDIWRTFFYWVWQRIPLFIAGPSQLSWVGNFFLLNRRKKSSLLQSKFWAKHHFHVVRVRQLICLGMWLAGLRNLSFVRIYIKIPVNYLKSIPSRLCICKTFMKPLESFKLLTVGKRTWLPITTKNLEELLPVVDGESVKITAFRGCLQFFTARNTKELQLNVRKEFWWTTIFLDWLITAFFEYYICLIRRNRRGAHTSGLSSAFSCGQDIIKVGNIVFITPFLVGSW